MINIVHNWYGTYIMDCNANNVSVVPEPELGKQAMYPGSAAFNDRSEKTEDDHDGGSREEKMRVNLGSLHLKVHLLAFKELSNTSLCDRDATESRKTSEPVNYNNLQTNPAVSKV